MLILICIAERYLPMPRPVTNVSIEVDHANINIAASDAEIELSNITRIDIGKVSTFGGDE